VKEVEVQIMVERELLLERRNYKPEKPSLWDKLSLAQKFATSSLTQFGYDLAFIRNSSAGNMAILVCDNNIATITDDGEINTSPEITIRL